MMRLAAFASASALLLFASPASGQHSLQPPFQPANQTALQNYSPEFPPNGPSYSLMRGQVMADQTARWLRERADSLDAFEMLLYTDRGDEAVAALHRLIQASPQQISGAFDLLLQRPQAIRGAVSAGRMPDPMPALIDAARQQFSRLSREEAASVDGSLALLEHPGVAPSPDRAAAIRAFMARYPGTAAAQEAEVDLIAALTADRAAWLPQLDAIARQHPGTTAAARALYEKAFQLSSNLRPGTTDPTDQFLAVLDIVKELESGRYPPNPWSARAPWLGVELYWRNVNTLAPSNVDRLLAACVAFVSSHFTLPEDGEMAAGVRQFLTTQVFDLFAQKGDGIGGIEQTLTNLERIDRPRAQYWRGVFYAERARVTAGPERSSLLDNARAALSSTNGSNLLQRVALATLASLDYDEGRYDDARAEFASYVAANPGTAFSWVAALRIGQCDELAGNLDAAVSAFEDTATRFASIDIARQLALLYSGRANERRGQFALAVGDYDRALAGWGDRRQMLQFDFIRGATADAATYRATTGIDLERHLAELNTSLQVTDGEMLERGRVLLTEGHRMEAAALFDRIVRGNPASPVRDEARQLSHRAQLQEAVELAGHATARDTDEAMRILAGMQRETDDVARAAQVVRATLVARAGNAREADALMRATLSAWHDAQRSPIRPSTLPSDVAKDVAAIRTRIFSDEPLSAEWRRAFEWRTVRSRFEVLNPELIVAQAGGTPKLETVYPSRVSDTALLVNTETMALLVKSLNGIVRSPAKTPGRVVPSFPNELFVFLERYVPADLCMIGGLCTVASVPNVLSVVFDDEARTRATVEIRAWSSGGRLRMEKQQGDWRVAGVMSAYVN